MSPLLEVRHLTKGFGGLVAVNDVSFSIEPGTITGLLGPNGAGKTTLFNLLTGFLRPDAGEAFLSGRPVTGLTPDRIVDLGCARTFQLCRLFPGMSVLENVLVACQAPRNRSLPSPTKHTLDMLEAVGLAGRATQPAETLPYGDQRRLEIARALATRPTLLLLDEPFAGLGSSEIAPLSALIRRLNLEQGLSILIIEHRLREFMQLVSRVIALDFGRVIADGGPDEILQNPRVIRAYIGSAGAAVGAA